MDFDMDDIPNPDELEWLERNALYPEDEEEDQYIYPEDLEPIQPPITAPENQINTKKRSLPVPDNDVTPSPAAEATPSSNEKRNRVSTPEAEIEDDWLRYSPPIIDTIYSAPPDPVVEEERFISRFASEIDGNCIAVTGPDGNRVYAKICQGEMNDDSSKKLKIKGYADSLISEPINVLMSKMEQEALTKALQASSESLHNLVHDESSVVSEKLWVDKYAPSSFTDLLSDEHTNREVLLWLKQWDSCVFGSEIRSTTDDVLSALKRHSSLPHHKKVSDTSFTSKNGRLPYSTLASTNYSSLGRESSIFEENHGFSNKKSRGAGPPDHKVLLLCGPPGLGKTTLAHVAAKHCGYRVVEINASDDRSSSTTETKILDVLQMNSIMSDGKPKCLVIDEIDGSLGEGKGAVEVILKMVAADKKSETGKGDGAQESERGKASSRKRRKATLCRPVICICNDLYAPALRPLRQVAKVYVFVQPTINRVVNRLKYICYKEGFRTSSVSLTALAEYTECDIRSCLNTLQFLNKKNEQLNLLEIGSQIVGRKDVSRSAFDVWKEIFQKRKLKRERRSSIGCGTLSNDFDFLHSLVSNRGEYELTMDGIHENMLKLHYHDPLMQKTVECFDILGISDYLHNYIMRTQQMSLLAYQPSKAIAIRCLISQIEKPNIEWPKSFQRFRTLFAEKKDMLRSWQATITPFLSRHLSAASFVEDSLSLFLHILSPSTLTPVALHSHSDREKGVLTQLIDTMVSYSITYKNKRIETLPGTYRHDASAEAPLLSFDPPIDEFISFKDYRSEYVGLNLAMKQVLLHEVEKKKFLRESIGRGAAFDAGDKAADQPLPRPGNGKPQITSDPYTVKDKLYSTESNGKTSTTLIKSGAKRSAEGDAKVKAPGAAKKPSAGSFNFFDRFRKLGGKDSQNSLQNMLKQATLERDSRPLLFKFNEGFTNAVKRPVKVRDLLF